MGKSALGLHRLPGNSQNPDALYPLKSEICCFLWLNRDFCTGKSGLQYILCEWLQGDTRLFFICSVSVFSASQRLLRPDKTDSNEKISAVLPLSLLLSSGRL